MLTKKQVARLEAIQKELHLIAARETTNGLSPPDRREQDRLINEANGIMGEDGRATAEDRADPTTWIENFLEAPRGPSAGHNRPYTGPGVSQPRARGVAGENTIRCFDPDGNIVPMLRAGQKFEDLTDRDGAPIRTVSDDAAGAFLLHRVTGKYRDSSARLEIEAAGSVGEDSEGGYTVPTPVHNTIIRRALPLMAAQRLGATVILGASPTLKVVGIGDKPVPAWKAENKDGAESKGSFRSIDLTAKTLFHHSRDSEELFADGVGAERALLDLAAEVTAQAFDRAAFQGTGAAQEPMGVLHTPGVPETAGVGAIDYDALIDGLTVLEDANCTPNGIVYSPGVKGALSKLKDSTGQYITPPDAVTSVPRIATKQVEDDFVLLGDWSNLLLFIRRGVTIDVTRNAGDAFGKFQVAFRVWMRGDVALARLDHFHRLLGVTL